MITVTNIFQGVKLIKDEELASNEVDARFKLPSVNHPQTKTELNSFPAPIGSMVYDPTTNTIFYSNGFDWFQLMSGGGGTVTQGYSFSKSGALSILSGVETVISSWSIGASPAYSTLVGWDLINGVYTASIEENISIHVNITWSAGFSTLGNRIIRIQYKPNAGVWTTIKETITQPDANIAIVTTQECCINAYLDVGDSVRIVAFQDSGVAVDITSGNQTTSCGFRTTV